MKTYSILFILCIFHFTALSQTTFQRVFGGVGNDEGYCVKRLPSGGYINAGTVQNMETDDYDGFLLRTNSNGDTLWTKRYGGINNDNLMSVALTSDGGFILSGSIGDEGINHSICLIKTDENGDTTWTRSLGGYGWASGNSVGVTADNGYLVSGLLNTSTMTSELFAAKFNSVGDTLWTRYFGGLYEEKGSSFRQLNDGGFIIAGSTESFGAGQGDAYLLKVNAEGDTAWTKTYGGINRDVVNSIDITLDGGFILAGETESFGAGSNDVYLIRTTSNGDTLWTRTFGNENVNVANSVLQTNDGGFLITGTSEGSEPGSYDIYLIKTNHNGDTLWTRSYGGEDENHGWSSEFTNEGGYITYGSTSRYGAGGLDAYLLKLDASGNSGCSQNQMTTAVGSTLTVIGNPPTTVHKGSVRTHSIIHIENGAVVSDPCAENFIGAMMMKDHPEVFPNPFSHSIIVTGTIAGGMITVLDLSGKIIHKLGASAQSTQIDTDNWSPGFYILQYVNGGKCHSVKIAKI